MPSTTTPTAGPWDSPNVVTTKSWPMDDDTLPPSNRCAPRGASPARRSTLGCHRQPARGLPHASAFGRRARGEHLRVPLPPVLLVRSDHALDLDQVARADVGARAGDPGLAALPRDDVLAGVIEEQLRVHDLAIHHRTHHLPVRGGHAEPAVLVRKLEVARLD